MAAGLWWVVRSSALEGADAGEASAVWVQAPRWVAPSRNGDRRRERRLEAYLPARSAVRRNRYWFKPWCLSRTKRLCDIVGAAAILLMVAPLMVAIAIAIKLDQPGPVFFRQWRTGLAGRRFRIFKFRTMGKDAEKEKERLRALSHHGPNSPDFKIREDPRVTRVGKLLRRTSLDELPNLINIVRGEMSLVGPRPTSFGIDVYADWHLERLVVPPGLTGLWQVSGRSEIDFDDRVKLDRQYIRQQSIMLDLKILLFTVGRVFDGRGAC